MVVTHAADQTYEFDPDALPLQVTAHNATVVLSSFLLATIVAYLACQLYRLRVHFPRLPRLLRNLLWIIFAEPNLGSLPQVVSQIIRMTLLSSTAYLVSRYWMVSSPPVKPNPFNFSGLATLTLSDGSTSTTMLSSQDEFKRFVASSLGDIATAKWNIKFVPRSSTATPT